MEDHQAGVVRCRFGMFEAEVPKSWVPPNHPNTKKRVIIVANLFRAIDLPSGDSDGLSDPYVQLSHQNQVFRSDIQTKVLDPLWNQRIVINTYIEDDHIMPLIIKIFDYDGDDKLPDFLGSVIVDELPNQTTTLRLLNTIPAPKWYELRYSPTLKFGKILMSFQLTSHSELVLRNLIQIRPKKKMYKMKVRILAIRELQSSGIFSIKNPYIELNLTSLKGDSNVPMEQDVVTAKSKPKSTDSNAIVNEVIMYVLPI